MFDRVPIELHEADRPQFHSDAAWGDLVNMTVGFGHGISVTPLHVVDGTAAIANGGMLMHPTMLAVDDAHQPEGKRVMRQSTSDVMRRLMRLVVTNGYGKKAEVAGYYPGGKTGTAEKNCGHGYKKHANVSAFMCVFPMQAPRYAVYMMLDEPHGNASTGYYSTAGAVAAPAAGKVIARIGPILGLMPDVEDAPAIDDALAIPLQPPHGMTLGPIRVITPAPETVSRQLPVVPARAPAGQPVVPVSGSPGTSPGAARPNDPGQADFLHRTQLEPVGPIPLKGRPLDKPRVVLSAVPNDAP
jgi:cell division protein FtsI (penicillin-binding protein 3)